MKVVRTAEHLRAFAQEARHDGRIVGFVPTMGALHEGHVSLFAEARRRASHDGLVVASIFVNPTQFGPNEDFVRYPRTLPADLEKSEQAGIDIVFTPEVSELYPPGEETRVRVGALADVLCGPFRPGHFEGVATIVTKLFALVGPSVAVFGRKDYQQLRIVDRLARDLCLGVTVVGHRTLREPDGLAKSSRNAYLSPGERERATAIPRGLSNAMAAFRGGERRVPTLLAVARASIEKAADSIDYVSLCDPESLAPLGASADGAHGTSSAATVAGAVGERALLAIALRIGSTRLIDNVVLGEDESPLN